MAERNIALVFDVNETLLDLRGLDPPFEQVFGDASVRVQWFQQLLQNALVSTITGAYADFGSLGRAALRMVAARRGREIGEDDTKLILGTIRSLPPHPEVRLATLTNSTEAVARDQLENAGLAPLFERILSADTVQRLKPAPEPYGMAARELGVSVGQLYLVAAHAWDIAGALRAGCRAAFVARPGMVIDPLAPEPDVVGADLAVVAKRLLELPAPGGPDFSPESG